MASTTTIQKNNELGEINSKLVEEIEGMDIAWQCTHKIVSAERLGDKTLLTKAIEEADEIILRDGPEGKMLQTSFIYQNGKEALRIEDAWVRHLTTAAASDLEARRYRARESAMGDFVTKLEENDKLQQRVAQLEKELREANKAIYTREQLLLADNDYNYGGGAGAGGEGAYDDEFTDGCFDQSWDNTGFRM